MTTLIAKLIVAWGEASLPSKASYVATAALVLIAVYVWFA